MCRNNSDEKITELPITEEVGEFGEIFESGLPDSKKSETSYFQSQMHFDDSVESIADSDSTTVSSESLGNMCKSRKREREECGQHIQAIKRTV